MNKIARLAMVGIASVGLVATMNSAATAAPTAASVVAGPAGAQDWGGKKRYAATRCLEWGRVE
jgi:hypothetical protein